MNDFQNYISKTRKLIETRREDLDNNPDRQKIVDWNAPFVYHPKTPSDKAILMIHGLGDSCFQLRELGEFFQKQGFNVYSILLPGHGTRPADTLSTSYKDWINAVNESMMLLQKSHKNISICGFSTGASLAIHYAYNHPNQTQQLFLLSPAIKIKARLAPCTGIVAFLGKYIKLLAWLNKSKETNLAKYTSFTFNAAWQIYRLTRKIKSLKLENPIHLVLSADDETIDYKAAIQFFNRQPNKTNSCLLFTNNKTEAFKDERIRTHKGACPEKHTANISHVGIMSSSKNIYYGEDGAYTKMLIGKSGITSLGALNDFEVKTGSLKLTRLYFNPYFDVMCEFFKNKLT